MAEDGPINELNRLAPLSKTPNIGLALGKRVSEFLIADYARDGRSTRAWHVVFFHWPGFTNGFALRRW